jgi:hypothetical protein
VHAQDVRPLGGQRVAQVAGEREQRHAAAGPLGPPLAHQSTMIDRIARPA